MIRWQDVLRALVVPEDFDMEPYASGFQAGTEDALAGKCVPYPREATAAWQRGYRHGLAVALSAMPPLP